MHLFWISSLWPGTYRIRASQSGEFDSDDWRILTLVLLPFFCTVPVRFFVPTMDHSNSVDSHRLLPPILDTTTRDIEDDTRTALVDIVGMTCKSCVQAVTKALQQHPSITHIRVSLQQNNALIRYQPSDHFNEKDLLRVIDEAGFDASVRESNIAKDGKFPGVELETSLESEEDSISREMDDDAINRDKEFRRNTPLFSTPVKGSETTPANVIHSPAVKPPLDDISLDIPSSKRKQIHLEVHGMTCSSCVHAIESQLRKTPGIFAVQVSLLSERADIDYDADHFRNADQIIQLVEELGFEAHPLTIHTVDGRAELTIRGMTCSACVGGIEHALGARRGIHSVVVSLSTEKAVVKYDPLITGVRDILDAIEDMGFEAILFDADSQMHLQTLAKTKEIQEWKASLLRCLWFFVPEFLISHVLPHIPAFRNLLFMQFLIPGLFFTNILELLLTIPIQFGIGWRFYRAAFNALKHGSATMDVLIVTSTTFSFGFSVFAMFFSMVYPDMFPNSPPMTFFETSTM